MGLSISAVMLSVGSILVSIAALCPHKEYKGDGKADDEDENSKDV